MAREYKWKKPKQYVVVDFKKVIIGTFDKEKLEEFFNQTYESLKSYIKNGTRFNILYYIYAEEKYKKLFKHNPEIKT